MDASGTGEVDVVLLSGGELGSSEVGSVSEVLSLVDVEVELVTELEDVRSTVLVVVDVDVSLVVVEVEFATEVEDVRSTVLVVVDVEVDVPVDV